MNPRDIFPSFETRVTLVNITSITVVLNNEKTYNELNTIGNPPSPKTRATSLRDNVIKNENLNNMTKHHFFKEAESHVRNVQKEDAKQTIKSVENVKEKGEANFAPSHNSLLQELYQRIQIEERREGCLGLVQIKSYTCTEIGLKKKKSHFDE